MSFRKGNLRLAMASIKSAKVRSFLTMLGIVIGVSAVICVVCIGEGVKRQISQQITHFGADVITIRPGVEGAKSSVPGGDLLGSSGLPRSSTNLLSHADLEVVQSTPGVAYAVPLSVASGSVKGDHTVQSPLVIATSPELPEVLNQSIEAGDFFDADTASRRIVLGQQIARELFDDSAPLGQTVTYRGQDFIVTGIFSSFSTAPFSITADFNNAIFLPYSTAQTLNGGNLAIYQILVKAAPKQNTKALAQAVDTRLIRSHGGSRETTVLDADDSIVSSSGAIQLLTTLIIGVATIALVVGGVGIMNVMLVSVTERMHEIGLRKAIGATNRQILNQFMTEAFVLSAMGALIGVVISLAVVGLLRTYSGLQPVLVWQVLVVTPLVAILVGVVFGTAPALKAARKDPIEALRHE